MKTIKIGINWRDYQKETLKTILSNTNNDSQIYTLCSPRQCGKTTICESLLLHYAINFKGSFSIFVSPTFKQCRKVFNEIKNSLKNTPLLSNCNESQLEITFWNDSKIVFCSGESSVGALQGFTVKKGILIFDESAFLQNEIFQALFPTVDVHKCPILLASTPRFREGLFYEYFTKGQEGASDIITFNWEGFTLLSPSKLQFYKETLPENVFKNYYLGEFVDFGNGVFGDFGSCINNNFERTGRYYMGVDWGTGSNGDDTAIAVFNNKKQMVDLKYFCDQDETETIETIVNMIQKWNPVKTTVERNSIGQIFYGLLKKKLDSLNMDNEIRGIITTNATKQSQVQKLQVAIQANDITFFGDKKLKTEFNNYEAALSKTGKITYNAKPGSHDDICIACMLAVDSISSGNYAVA